jgi:plasmid stabilization system protein ParE
MARKEKPLEIAFTPSARADWIAIWQWNASEYGERRAGSYMGFLEAEIARLARSPSLGLAVPEFPRLRRRLVKRRSRGHGHIVFYRVQGSHLVVVHIFHTAQDWQSKL